MMSLNYVIAAAAAAAAAAVALRGLAVSRERSSSLERFQKAKPLLHLQYSWFLSTRFQPFNQVSNNIDIERCLLPTISGVDLS